MSGPGDVGGEVSGDEAAWRDLIARFDAPASQATEAAPWPASEDLSEPGSPDPAPAEGARSEGARSEGARSEGARSEGAPSEGAPSDSAKSDSGKSDGAPSDAGPADAGTAVTGYLPPEGTKIIRFASDPRAYLPPEEPDEPYVPERLPPPARLDPVSKGAWVALVCGPGYLLLGTVLHWSISGTEALAAIAAFIAGFVILVVKMGDRPPRDDDDDGAVI
jgi:hypothetical protein